MTAWHVTVPLRSTIGQSVLQDLIALYKNGCRVAYQPVLRPVQGRCPVSGCARLAGSSTAKAVSTKLISLSGVTLSLSVTLSHVLDTARNVSTSHNGRLLSGCINGRIRLGGCSMSRNSCRKTSRALTVLSQFDALVVLYVLWYLGQNICGPTSKAVTVSTCLVRATILSNNKKFSDLVYNDDGTYNFDPRKINTRQSFTRRKRGNIRRSLYP